MSVCIQQPFYPNQYLLLGLNKQTKLSLLLLKDLSKYMYKQRKKAKQNKEHFVKECEKQIAMFSTSISLMPLKLLK